MKFSLSLYFACQLMIHLWTDAITVNDKKLLKNKLDKVGPTIEYLFCEFLRLTFILTPHFFMSLNMSKCNAVNNHQINNDQALQLKDYGRMQSTSLDKSMKTPSTTKLLSTPSLHSSEKQIKAL